MPVCLCAWSATQIHTRNTELTQIATAPTTSSSRPLWLTRMKACYGKIHTRMYIYIHTYSLDPHITGLWYSVYPVTAPGSPGLPVAALTGRHTHTHMHKQLFLIAGPGTGIEVTWQWYCKGLWKRRCTQGRLPHTAAWKRWWEPGCSPASGTGHRESTVTQGSPQQWFNSGRDTASEALDGFLTIIEGNILIFNQTLALWPVQFVYNLPESPCSAFCRLKAKRKKKWHCNITAYIVLLQCLDFTTSALAALPGPKNQRFSQMLGMGITWGDFVIPAD